MTQRRRPGFTLIELLTVIAIIGILAGMLFPAIGGIRKKAKQASATTAFTQWAGAITRYKQVYGYYPNIGKVNSGADTPYQLEDAATNSNFVKALSGRQPDGSAITSKEERLSLNRNAEEFCSFGKDDFGPKDPTMLVDRFGNTNIRVILDTDNNTRILGIATLTKESMPEDIRGVADTKVGIPARVIIYTTDLGGDCSDQYGDTGADNFAQVFVIQ